MAVEQDQIYEGKVIRLTNFGAFVELSTGDTGLVHISEIDSSYVKNVEDFLRENDQVRVKVLAVKGDGKIDLSIRQAADPGSEPAPPPPPRRRAGRDPEFEKMMKQFMKKSEQTLVDIRRNRETKRT
jgi:S1 RNA binding domain protein